MPEGKKIILVVDDEPSLVRSLGRLIRTVDRRIEIITAYTAEAAIDVLQKKGLQIDIVFTDFNMFGKTGADVVAEAQKTGIRAIAVIATMTDQQKAMIPANIPQFEKPPNFDELKAWIRDNLAQTS